jgi:hypothetical protein
MYWRFDHGLKNALLSRRLQWCGMRLRWRKVMCGASATLPSRVGPSEAQPNYSQHGSA